MRTRANALKIDIYCAPEASRKVVRPAKQPISGDPVKVWMRPKKPSWFF